MEGKRSFDETNSTFDNAFLGTPPTKRARRSYEPSFKIKVIKETKKSSVAIASRNYSLHESMVRRWILMENVLEKSAQSPKPLKSLGSGRKPLNLDLEYEMFCYFLIRIF